MAFWLYLQKYIRTIISILLYTSIFSGVVPFLFYLLNRKELNNYSIIVLYLSIGVLTDLILTPLFEIIFRSPFIGVRLFTLVEFFLLTSYFFKITNINYKLLCYYFLITIFLLVFVYENFINFQNNFDSIATGVSALSILIYAILFLYYKLKQNQIII